VAFGAEQLRFDPNSQEFDVSGNVHVDEPPFHLSSDALRLRRVRIGAEVEGQGKLAFCPCLGTPIAVRFSGATVAPPHDVILRNPVLEVFGVPLAWLPVFWLRSAGRPGLLSPDVEWRGADGFFAGGGVHLPWRPGDTTHGLDLRAGGYAQGGVAVDASLTTVTTSTRVTWDRLHDQDGIGVRATGATAIASPERGASVAWDVDALRGQRAVAATTDLDAAARPFDRAQAEAAWRADGWTIASTVRWTALRGADALDNSAAGPMLAVRRSDAIGHVGAYDVTFEGGQLGAAGGASAVGAGPLSFVRGEGGATFNTLIGPAAASLGAREVGVVSDDGSRSGIDAAVQVRAAIGLPLVRGFASADEGDPWVHRTEPRLEAAWLDTHASDVFVAPAARGMAAPSGGAWILAARWANSLGRTGSRGALGVDAIAGLVGDAGGTSPSLRLRAAAGGPFVGLVADGARVFAGSATSPAAGGGAVVARVRVGPDAGLNVTAHVAERDGVDPVLARALVEAPLEPASGFLSTTGWTGGARLALPLGSRVTARGGSDYDFEARALVAAMASLELHDPCNCVIVRATAAHRIGRDGVDAWLSVDLPFGGR
jgi:hypothetical protein